MTATRTISSLAAPFTQSQLSTALQTAFTNAGFTGIFDSYTSGTDLILVYAFVVDATKTFGTSYLRIRITNAFVINQSIYSTWNASTHAGTNASTEVAWTALVSTTSVTFNALSSTGEIRLVLIQQGTVFIPLGMICPSTKRGSWDLNNWNWGFVFTATTMLVLRGTSLNQYSNSDNTIALAGSSQLATANPYDNSRDVLQALTLLNQSNQGFCGQTSTDLAIVATNGSSRFDTIISSGSSYQYLVINPGSGGIGVRVV